MCHWFFPWLGGYGMMGFGGLFSIVWMVIWVLFLVGIGYLVFYVIKNIFGTNKVVSDDQAIELLKLRYAKGEISKEEFERMKKDITG